MTIYLNFAELNSLASLTAIAPGPVSDAVVLTHVKVEVSDNRRLVAYATDRHVAARIEFNLAHEADDATLVEFTIGGEVLKKALAAAKRAPIYARHHGASLVHIDPNAPDATVALTVDGDRFRSHPPMTPGSDRVSTYPAIGRLFPESVEHVNDIAAGVPVDLEMLTKVAKLRHPDDMLTGRNKTAFGAYRVSLSKADKAGDFTKKSAPLLLTRREGGITVIAQPMMLASAVNSKDRGAL